MDDKNYISVIHKLTHVYFYGYKSVEIYFYILSEFLWGI